jgi:hypothetical protein
MTAVIKYWKQFRPCLKENTVSNIKDNRLMQFGEIIDVYSENHTESVNTLCGQNAQTFCVKECRTYSNGGLHKPRAPGGPSD